MKNGFIQKIKQEAEEISQKLSQMQITLYFL